MKTTLQLETRAFPNLRKVNAIPARVITLHEEHEKTSEQAARPPSR